MYELKAVGQRIKSMRIKKNISVHDMAKQTGIGYTTIYNWEKGTQKPEIDNVVLLSEFFNISCDYILKGVENN